MTADSNREQILRRFEEWLDRALAAEAPPSGIDAEILAGITAEPEEPEGASSYQLWSAMTALSQEVKLQGRAFKELNTTIASQPGGQAEEIRAEYREREREVLQQAQRETERRVRKEILGALIDLRDRLERGIESARRSASEMTQPAARGWLERLVSKPPAANPATAAVAALIKGSELGLERLDQTLEEFKARPIRCLGQPFDPKKMNAIDKEESSSAVEGTVLEVYRSGYEWNGEVFRPAQVKVAVAPGRNDE